VSVKITGRLAVTCGKAEEKQAWRDFVATLDPGTYLGQMLKGLNEWLFQTMDDDMALNLLDTFKAARDAASEVEQQRRNEASQWKEKLEKALNGEAKAREAEERMRLMVQRMSKDEEAAQRKFDALADAHDKLLAKAQGLEITLAQAKAGHDALELEVLRLKAALWDMFQAQAAK
jgi:hypothetical protein